MTRLLVLGMGLLLVACASGPSEAEQTAVMENAVLTAEAEIIQELPSEVTSVSPVCNCAGSEIDAWKFVAGDVLGELVADIDALGSASVDDREEVFGTIANNLALREVALERLKPPPCLQELHDTLVLTNTRFQEAFELAADGELEAAITRVDLAIDAMEQTEEKIDEFDPSQIDC